MKEIPAVITGYEVVDKEGNIYGAPVGVRGVNVPTYVQVHEDGTYLMFMFGRMLKLEKKDAI